jgi:anti-anti-sigma factor
MVDLALERGDRLSIVSVTGSVDSLTAEQVTNFLAAQVESGQMWLVLDLGQVDFMSSAGLRTILETARRCREQGGDLCLAAAQPGVERTLSLSGFPRVLEIYASVNEATANFGP